MNDANLRHRGSTRCDRVDGGRRVRACGVANLWFWVDSRRSNLGACQFHGLRRAERGITSGWTAGFGRTGGMTQFQAIAILMPVFACVIMLAVARWTQYQDRAPEDNPVPPKSAQRDP